MAMTTGEMLQHEYTALRADLQELKQCQIRYFTLSVTGTGAVLGFARLMHDSSPSTLAATLTSLAPLAIVLPCWSIFFDKATTITRLVGYLRLIEEQIQSALGHESKYLGFERSLRRYRDLEKKRNERGRSWVRNQFWVINHITFFGLSLFSILLASRSLSEHNPTGWAAFSIAAALTLISALLSTLFLWRITWGPYSYNRSEEFWRDVLPEWNPAAANSGDDRSHAGGTAPAAQGAAADRQGPRFDQPR